MKILAIGDFHGKFPVKLKKEIEKNLDEIDLILALGDYTGLDEWRPFFHKQLTEAKKGKEVMNVRDVMSKKEYNALVKKDFKAGLDVLKELNKFGKKVYVIFGNGDWYNAYHNRGHKTFEPKIKPLKNLYEMSHKNRKFNGINFIGVGGYMDPDIYFNKKEWAEAQNKKSLKLRIKRRSKSKNKFFNQLTKSKGKRIFVLHYTPVGAFDIVKSVKANPMNGKSVGVGFFTSAIKKYKPKLALCGHMHEYQGKKRLGNTIVVNPGAAYNGKAAIIDFDEEKNQLGKVRFLK
jgi:Icc-related predicted phosphoesterase